MRMNTSLPAQIQTPDLAGTIMRGREMQMAMQEAQNRNALAGYIRENGAGIMAGDTNALAGLAAYDPAMALGIQRQNKQDAREERDYGLREKQINAGMANDVARLDLARQQAAQQAAEHGARMSAYEREATAAEIQRKGTMAAAAYQSGAEAWDAFRASDMGKDFAPFDYKTAPIGIAGARGTLDGLGLGGGDQFTLGEGQTRYDAQGNVIAQGPDKGPSGGFQTLDERARAAGMEPGTAPYQDFMRTGGTSRTEQAPPGYRFTQTGDLEPIPGGEPYAKARAAARVADTAQGRRDASTDVIIGAAERAREVMAGASIPTTGVVGQAAAVLPSSQASELRRQVDVLKSNATIESLTAMRQSSPTGGALGNVTEKEGQMLAAASGALDANASAEDFQRALDNYERTLLRIVHGPEAGDRIFAQTRSDATGAVPAGVDPEIWGVMTPEERALWQN